MLFNGKLSVRGGKSGLSLAVFFEVLKPTDIFLTIVVLPTHLAIALLELKALKIPYSAMIEITHT